MVRLQALPQNIEHEQTDKHCSLLQYSMNYSCKSFIVQTPGPQVNTIHSLHLILWETKNVSF
jgi:hypothetical protein